MNQDDQAMIKHCCNLMGYKIHQIFSSGMIQVDAPEIPWYFTYDPLTIKEQALNLVEKFNLSICPLRVNGEVQWVVKYTCEEINKSHHSGHKNLSRAIVMCVNQIQKVEK